LNIFGLILFFLFSHGENLCVVPQSEVVGVELQTKNKIKFFPGEELKFISKNKKSTVVSLGDVKYSAKFKKFKKISKPSCGLSVCVHLKNSTEYLTAPQGEARASMVNDSVYPVLTRSGGWFRVQTSDGFVWLSRTQLMSLKEACDASVTGESSVMIEPEGPEAENPLRYQWQYGLEFGYIISTSSKPMEDLVSARPSGSAAVNNDLYDTPFIESVDGRMGWYLGVSLETYILWDIKAKYSLGYKRKVIDVVTRPNPPVAGTVTYDDLAREESTQNFGFIYLNTVIKHEGLVFKKILWQPGLNIGLDYSSDNFSQEFQTAPNKLTLYTKTAGYSSLEVYYGPRIDATYGSWTMGVMVNFNRYDLEPTLSFGYLF